MIAVDKAALRGRVREFLARLRAIRETGAGALPMDDLFTLCGVSTEGVGRRQLAARGSLEFTFDCNGCGTFCNEGPRVMMAVGPGELTVPRRISGRVRAADTEVVFDFDREAAPVGRAFFMELALTRIEVSESHVALRTPSGTFDQEYRF